MNIERLTLRLAGRLGDQIQSERTRRHWSLRELAGRAGLSKSMVQWTEAGHAATLESYVRFADALGLRPDFELVERRPRPARQEDPLHAAIGELLAARFSPNGLSVALDEPFQHYQFAGRADLLAWSVQHRALLHVENRTRFPNLQETFGSYNAKRAYLPSILAERVGVPRFERVTNVMLALWSAEVLHSIRLHAASFRAVCPDPSELFQTWWSGDLPSGGRPSSVLIVFDPVAEASRRRFIGLGKALSARPRYRGYREAVEALGRAASRASSRDFR